MRHDWEEDASELRRRGAYGEDGCEWVWHGCRRCGYRVCVPLRQEGRPVQRPEDVAGTLGWIMWKPSGSVRGSEDCGESLALAVLES